MDKKKRTIYIAIIIVCILGTVAILFLSSSGPEAPTAQELAGPINGGNPQPASAAASGDLTSTDYPIPSVFPAEDSFSTAILNSSKIQSLTNYNPVVVSGAEVNREDPFARY